MSNCLVTKLNDAVNNDSLIKVGEFRIGVPKIDNPTEGSQCITLSFKNPTTLEIIGDGYFTDKTLQQNYGNKISSNDSRIQNGEFYVGNSEYVEVSIGNKYDLVYIALNTKSTGTNEFVLSIDDLKYTLDLPVLLIPNTNATGDLSALSKLTKLSNIIVSSTKITGDLSSLNELTRLKYITLNGYITGDLSALSKLTELSTIIVSSTKITGDLSFFADKTKMSFVQMEGTLTGDVANLKNCSELGIFMCGRYSVLSGDLSQLPAKCKYFEKQGSITNLTWTTRPSSSCVTGLYLPEWQPTNLDEILQNLATCQVIHTASSPAYSKRITIGGTRTSASDAAVATLQNKGFSVQINK